MNAAGRTGRCGRPSQRTNCFKRLLSCLFGCVSPAEESATPEVDISTPVYNPADVSVSTYNTYDNLPPRRGMSRSRARQSVNEATNSNGLQPPSKREDAIPESANEEAVSPIVVDEVEVDITAGINISVDDDGDCVDQDETKTGTMSVVCASDGSGVAVVGEDVDKTTCQQLVACRPEDSCTSTSHQMRGRISREVEEVRELEKVEQWQRARAILGRNNLLRHSCHPDAPRRKGIFDFYNQEYALIADIQDIVVLSGPSGRFS